MVGRSSGSLCGCDDGERALEASEQKRLGLFARRSVVTGAVWGVASLSSGCQQAVAQTPNVRLAPLPLILRGMPQQSGVLVGETVPNAIIDAAGIAATAGSDGRFIIGFDRDALGHVPYLLEAEGSRARPIYVLSSSSAMIIRWTSLVPS